MANQWLLRQAARWTQEQRIVTAKSPVVLHPVDWGGEKPSDYSKPPGLWYAAGNAWVEWCRSEIPEWLQGIRFCYQVDIDTTKILQLKNAEEIDDFTRQFGIEVIPGLTRHIGIDWHKVAKQFSGIEIIPYCWERRLEHAWYYGWDIASGCCWGIDAIKLELLAKRKQRQRKGLTTPVNSVTR